jgi:hypothetical protein
MLPTRHDPFGDPLGVARSAGEDDGAGSPRSAERTRGTEQRTAARLTSIRRRARWRLEIADVYTAELDLD